MGLRLSACLLMVVAAAALAASRASADPQQSAVLAVAQQFIGGINKGDLKAAVATCASPAIIVDDFAPHVWQGPDACANWAAAFKAANSQGGITDTVVTLGTPWHVNVDGDTAYVVVPTRYTYRVHGKPALEAGSVWTVALKKTSDGWRISGWAWAQH